ncbi:MAG: gliding motility-associated C-terminal domain-containing protein [Flavobacteriales bacterium]
MKQLRLTLKALFLGLALMHGGGAFATHILGGNLGYTSLGETSPGSQMFRYRVSMQFYLNCGSDSNYPTLASLLSLNGGNIPVGVYIEDPAAPDADKARYTVLNLTLTDSAVITPQVPSGCSLGSGLCVLRGDLTGTVDLPLNFGGYHLYFQMNSRNNTILNLNDPGSAGIGFYAFIPPPLLQNSSPIWLGSPTPMLCISDTSTFINSATDPEGDQLIFSFKRPYGSVGSGGGIIQPPTTLPDNIPLVDYAPGYSVTQSLGTGGYAFINGATGLTRYRPPNQGYYVVAVEVREFRNGNLIGITRRDLQLQAMVCPPNVAPVAIAPQPETYTVQAGDNLCFGLGFQDPEGDSLHLLASGTIFDVAQYDPPATITAPASGNGNVSTAFCWDTQCDQSQTQPYLFSVSVSDMGCPPRTLDVVYQVYVAGIAAPSTITGPEQVCSGQPANYTSSITSGNTATWTISGGTITSGQGTGSITVEWGIPGAASLTVMANNPQGCTSTSQSLLVTIVPLPNADAGSDTTICAGNMIVLGGAPSGPVGSGFQWNPGQGLSNPASANPTVTPSSTTAYVLQVTRNGCTNRDTVQVTVSQPSVDAGVDVAFCAGGQTQLNATGSGSVSWSPTTGLDDASIHAPIAAPTVTTTYIASLTDPVGCTAMDSVTVTVIPQPDAGIDGGLSICASGQPTGLMAQLGGSPDAGGNWLDPEMMAHGPDLDPATDPAGSYTYIAGTGSQCADSAVVLVVVVEPIIAFSGVNSICAGGSTQISASGGVQYTWTPASGISDPASSSPFFFPESTTAYSVEVTDTAGCSATAQITVTVHPLPVVNAGNDTIICAGAQATIGGMPTSPTAAGYQWNPATGLNDATTANPIATPAGTTSYTVSVTDGAGCSNTDSMTLTVQQLPALVAGPDTSFCAGGSVQLNATGTGSFHWTPDTGLSNPDMGNPIASPAETTTYVVLLTDDLGCSSGDTLTVFVHVLPAVSTGTGPWLCLGSSVILSTSGSDGTYSWTPASSLNDPTSTAPTATPGSTTSYTVTVTDMNNCTASDMVTVTVGTDPPINAGPEQHACVGVPVELGGSPTSVPGSSYLWAPPSGLNDPTSANPMASPTGSTEYTLTVTNDTCTSTASVLVNVGTQGQAGFTARLEPGCDALRTFLTDTSMDAVTWHWDFGNGTTSDSQNPQTMVPYGTNTLISLVISDASGCTDTISQLFTPGTYDALVRISLPNVFTPNGDGENDLFTLGTSAFLGPCASMEVMNRWGQTIFLSQGNDIKWDGTTIAGIPAIPGTYFYVVRVKDLQFKGNVTLLR